MSAMKEYTPKFTNPTSVPKKVAVWLRSKILDLVPKLRLKRLQKVSVNLVSLSKFMKPMLPKPI